MSLFDKFNVFLEEKFMPIAGKIGGQKHLQAIRDGLILSMPLYDYTKSSKVQESKIEVLKQKALVNDLKNETAFEYEQIFTKIDTYLKQNETINKNIKLYEELIGANQISSEAGMTSKYDLEILENTKTINEFDILINKINILQQYAKLYFKIKN